MLQNSSTVEYKHKKFVERVTENGIVWALKSSEGFATSESNEYENVEVIPFWSDKAYALVHVKEEWENFEPYPMPLSEFLENWLVGMSNDGNIVGTNWDQNLFGKETEPLELALEISNHMIATGKEAHFEKYNNLTEYLNLVKKALGAD